MSSFSVRRLAFLLRNDLFIHRRAIIITAALIVCVQLVHGFTGYYYVKKYGFDPLNIFLFPGGYLLTAFAFKSLHNTYSATTYLMLPASIMEKYLSRYLLTSLGFMVGVTFLSSVSDLVGREITEMIYGEKFTKFYPFHSEYGSYFLLYLISQAVVFWCAVYFRKHTIIKILFIFLLFFLVVEFYMGIWLNQMAFDLANIFWNFGGMFGSTGAQEKHFILYLEDIIMWKLQVVHLPSIVLVMPLFWILGYFRLKRSEY
jgi:hypothetical protein